MKIDYAIRMTAVLSLITFPVLAAAMGDDRELQAQSMESIHVLAEGLSAFLEENPKWQSSQHGHFVKVEALRDHLLGPYLSEDGWAKVQTDGWGNPLLIWVRETRYAVVSFGKDGKPDYDYYSMLDIHEEIPMDVHSDNPDVDITHIGGSSFYQFPMGFTACCLRGGDPEINDRVRARLQ